MICTISWPWRVTRAGVVVWTSPIAPRPRPWTLVPGPAPARKSSPVDPWSYLSDYWTYANEILCIGSLWRSVWDVSFEILNFSFFGYFPKPLVKTKVHHVSATKSPRIMKFCILLPYNIIYGTYLLDF